MTKTLKTIAIPLGLRVQELGSETEASPSPWVVAHGSVAGKSHADGNCQDANFHQVLSDGWGVAVVCDGAGSAANSALGAKFVSQHLGQLLVSLYGQVNVLPTQAQWRTAAQTVLRLTYSALEGYTENQRLELPSLACTVIAVIYSPKGLLFVHIGDGRGAFRNSKGWYPIFRPTKGEEANTTVFFVTPVVWADPKKYIEMGVVKSPITAFAIMSDGCEYHAFEVNVQKANGKFHDPNKPYAPFFEPLTKTLLTLKDESQAEINKKWIGFLTAGTEGLKHEGDDKTMILGVFDA